MTYWLRTIAAALALCLAAGIPAARAQRSTVQQPCADVVGGEPYARCALWLDGNVVRRGAGGEIVARPGFIRPMRLLNLVSGDSARAQATRYEVNARRSNALGAVSALLFIAGYVVADSYHCEPLEFGFCSNADDTHVFTAGALVIASSAALLASLPFSIRARRASARAIWWHNARFAR